MNNYREALIAAIKEKELELSRLESQRTDWEIDDGKEVCNAYMRGLLCALGMWNLWEDEHAKCAENFASMHAQISEQRKLIEALTNGDYRGKVVR
jgi:hypothetical protein